MIIVGNIHLTPKARVIEIRFNTGTGIALFSYNELPVLIETLRNLRPPPGSIDPNDLFAPIVR